MNDFFCSVLLFQSAIRFAACPGAQADVFSLSVVCCAVYPYFPQYMMHSVSSCWADFAGLFCGAGELA